MFVYFQANLNRPLLCRYRIDLKLSKSPLDQIFKYIAVARFPHVVFLLTNFACVRPPFRSAAGADGVCARKAHHLPGHKARKLSRGPQGNGRT